MHVTPVAVRVGRGCPVADDTSALSPDSTADDRVRFAPERGPP